MQRPTGVAGKESVQEGARRAGVGDRGEVVVAPSQASEQPGRTVHQGQSQRPCQGGEHRPGEQPPPPDAGDERRPGCDGDDRGSDCGGDDRSARPRGHQAPPSRERRGADARRGVDGQQARSRHCGRQSRHGQGRRAGRSGRQTSSGRLRCVAPRHPGCPGMEPIGRSHAGPWARGRGRARIIGMPAGACAMPLDAPGPVLLPTPR
jgi:hypothetical protein